jgi:hypothetical protein
MTNLLLRVGAITMALGLASCAATPVLAPKGDFNGGQKVTLDRDWSDVSNIYVSNNKKTRMLTLDGFALNRLYISDGLGPNDPFLIGPQGNRASDPAPVGGENPSLSEQISYMERAIATLGYLAVEAKSPKPVDLGGVRAVRFELSMRTKEGLNYKALAQATTHKGKAYYILYLAPEVHYYDLSLKNAVAAMDTAKLP